MNIHQQKQIAVINDIEKQIKDNTLHFTTVPPVNDYEGDTRLCLTSVHIPHNHLINTAREIIEQLRNVEPTYYFYDNDSLHMTIKNVRVINNPPHFTNEDTEKAKEVFSEVIPHHQTFSVYFYRLLLFPTNLALIGTTDPELDSIILDLDKNLNKKGVPDDKKYSNDRYFFSNMTLARFPEASDTFKQKVKELSDSLRVDPYEVDSVTLLSCNAVCKKRQIIDMWDLQ